MRRREFLGVLGAATVPSLFNPELGPLARDIGGVSAMPTVTIIHSGTKANHTDHIQAFKDALALGYSGSVTVNDNNYANDKADDLDTFAKNIVTGGGVDVLVAAGGTRSAYAAYQATQQNNPNLQVVFTSVAEPTRLASNMTGICALTTRLDAQRLKLLAQLLPGKTDFGVILNQDRLDHNAQSSALDNEAAVLGLTLHYQPIAPKSATPVETQIDGAFQNVQNGIQNNGWGGALVAADPVFNNHRRGETGIIAIARNRKVPTIYQWREFAEDGGLISYGPNLTAAYTLAGDYTARILNQSATASQLPILPLENFELVINLKTAKNDLNLRVPPALLVQADRIIVK
jgi:putative tryptophan/tyrosine transport system substrate-binding protein